MPFVKLDCGLLKSTLWFDPPALHLFLTALLSASPMEAKEPLLTYPLDSTEPDAFIVPPGWYGLVSSSGQGLIHDALMDHERGHAALERLRLPEKDSRSPDFEGRRLVRVSGGFLVLNFEKYRKKDYGAAERAAAWRRAQKAEREARDAERANDRTSQPERTRTAYKTEAEAEAEKKETKRGGTRFVPPTLDEVKAYWTEKRLSGDPVRFFNHQSNARWRLSGGKGAVMVSWQLAAQNWSRTDAGAKAPPVAAMPDPRLIEAGKRLARQAQEPEEEP